MCIDLLEEKISINHFLDGLNTLTKDDVKYNFQSSEIILKSYPWNVRLNEHSREAIEKLRYATAEIKKCIGDKKEWRNIWRIAYRVHNEPDTIYKSIKE